MSDDASSGPVACMWCGTVAETLPATWTMQLAERGTEYLCEKCTRDNARQIEGSLPTDWW